MSNVPWHRRPAIIVALLVVFAPVGIPLMWMRFGWAKNIKIAASIVSVTVFAIAIWRGSVERADEERKAATVASMQPNGIRDDERVAKPKPEPAPQPPAPRAAPGGRELLKKQQLLAVPLKLSGFDLSSANTMPANLPAGFVATYVGTTPETEHLKVWLSANKSDADPSGAENERPLKIGDHDGVIVDNSKEKSFSVRWNAGGWAVISSVNFTRPVDATKARRAAERIAPAVSAALDAYLRNSPLLESEGEKHLAAIKATNINTKVAAFIAKIESVGIANDLIARASVDGKLSADLLVITVGSTWHRAGRQGRLVAAQRLWQVWSEINSPTNPDTSRIQLVDANGNKIGGSSLVAGSSIKVDN